MLFGETSRTMVWPFSESWPEKAAADVHDQTFDYVIVGGMFHGLPEAVGDV